MEVNVNTKAICTIDIDSAEAFRILCETLMSRTVSVTDICSSC